MFTPRHFMVCTTLAVKDCIHIYPLDNDSFTMKWLVRNTYFVPDDFTSDRYRECST